MHLLLLLHVITAWIPVRATQAETRGVVACREAAVLRGEVVEEEEVRLQRERDGRDSLPPTKDCSVGQENRTTPCELKHARRSYKPAISMDSGVLVDAFSGVLGKKDWVFAVGGGRARGTGSEGSGSTWDGGIENKVEELQRERDGREYLLGTDQQHCTTFCPLKHARSSRKPAICMDSGFWVYASSGVLGKED